jgi:hypothetical protein
MNFSGDNPTMGSTAGGLLEKGHITIYVTTCATDDDTSGVLVDY